MSRITIKMKRRIKRLLGVNISSMDSFLSFEYQRHNYRRLEHLASLNLPFHNSTIFEVGAGIGDHTSFFLDRGCRVVSTEVREENLRILRSRYPGIEATYLDLDNPPSEFDSIFDIVYSYGVLYHLKNPAVAIEFMAGLCAKILLLETCVSFGDGESIHLCKENIKNPTQAFSGQGCRPTRNWIYNELKRYFEFTYMPITQPNHEEFPIDWSLPPAAKKLTRAIFIASRQKLDNELLVPEIPMHQRRH